MSVLPYGRQSIDDADIQAVVECLKGDWLTQGPMVAAFEDALCQTTGAKFAVAVANGTAALHLANLALGVQPGDVGITSAITFLASANGLRYVGADVAFADVEADTGLVDVADMRSVAQQLAGQGKPPKVLIPVDMAGQTADLVAVRRLADELGAYVVEDAAHSLGATYTFDGATFRAGDCQHAHMAITSFHPVKHVTTGEGGAIFTNDEALHRKLLELRSHGMHKDAARYVRDESDPFVGPWYYEMADLGYNFRISDLQCALGVSQMTRLPGFIDRRRAIAAQYDAYLAEAPLSGLLAPIHLHEGKKSAYHLYVVQVKAEGLTVSELAERRKQLYHFMRERQILCQVHYVPVPWQPYYREHGWPRPEGYAGAERYYAVSLSLPMFPAMSDGDVTRVVEALASWSITVQG